MERRGTLSFRGAFPETRSSSADVSRETLWAGQHALSLAGGLRNGEASHRPGERFQRPAAAVQMFHVKHCGRAACPLTPWQVVEWRGEPPSRRAFPETRSSRADVSRETLWTGQHAVLLAGGRWSGEASRHPGERSLRSTPAARMFHVKHCGQDSTSSRSLAGGGAERHAVFQESVPRDLLHQRGCFT